MEQLPASMLLQDRTNACGWAFAAPFLANRSIAHCRSGEALLYPPHLQATQIHENAGCGLAGREVGSPPLDFSPLSGRGRQGYIGGIHAVLDRDYAPLAAMFARVIERSRRDASNGRRRLPCWPERYPPCPSRRARECLRPRRTSAPRCARPPYGPEPI